MLIYRSNSVNTSICLENLGTVLQQKIFARKGSQNYSYPTAPVETRPKTATKSQECTITPWMTRVFRVLTIQVVSTHLDYRTSAINHRGNNSKINFLNPQCGFFLGEANIQEIFLVGILALKKPIL